MVKNLPAMQETQVRSLGQEDSPEKEMATHSSILAWGIPWMGSLAGCSPWGHKEMQLSDEHQVRSYGGRENRSGRIKRLERKTLDGW